jgi:hypothetical protein
MDEQIISNVRVMRKGSLAQLVEAAAEARKEKQAIGFNSSI